MEASFQAGVLLGKEDVLKSLERAWERLEKVESLELRLKVFRDIMKGLESEGKVEIDKYWKELTEEAGDV